MGLPPGWIVEEVYSDVAKPLCPVCSKYLETVEHLFFSKYRVSGGSVVADLEKQKQPGLPRQDAINQGHY